jgi:hypothetical protein
MNAASYIWLKACSVFLFLVNQCVTRYDLVERFRGFLSSLPINLPNTLGLSAIYDLFLCTENGGQPGRKNSSVKPEEKKEEEYKDVLTYLYKGYKIADIAKLT